jgi:hypothetical protein
MASEQDVDITTRGRAPWRAPDRSKPMIRTQQGHDTPAVAPSPAITPPWNRHRERCGAAPGDRSGLPGAENLV